MSQKNKILVLIPTRNRADLAQNAIQSVREQMNSNSAIEIVISDNSTDENDTRQLQEICGDQGVRYIKPPEPLAMTAHWEWAWHAAFQDSAATHICYLTDRMIFRRGAIDDLQAIVNLHPQKIVSYNHDRINDYVSPVELEEERWSGRLFEIASEHLLYWTAQSLPAIALPRMLNCVVPRSVGAALHQRFGAIFNSLSPDYNFAFRALAECESLLYYDKTLLVHYAQARSNGASNARGIATRDSHDFKQNTAPNTLNAASPVPEFQVVGNSILHEYEMVRRETGDARFLAIDWNNYLEYMAREIAGIENAELRQAMEELWQEQRHKLSVLSTQAVSSRPAWQQSIMRKLNRVLWLAQNNQHQPFQLFLKRRFGKMPTDLDAVITKFETREAALEYVAQHHRERSTQPSNLELLTRLRRLPFP